MFVCPSSCLLVSFRVFDPLFVLACSLGLDESVLRIVGDAHRVQDSTCEARGVSQLELGTSNDFECERQTIRHHLLFLP
jgi:hypothetical protein